MGKMLNGDYVHALGGVKHSIAATAYDRTVPGGSERSWKWTRSRLFWHILGLLTGGGE